MAQWSITLSALAENSGFFTSTHTVAHTVHNFSSRDSDFFFWPTWAMQAYGTLTCRQKKKTTHAHRKQRIMQKNENSITL